MDDIERQPRVLLVEDDPEISRALVAALTASGFAALAAADGPTMDQHLHREEVDLVVLDIMLPGEDGLSICRRLRADSGLPIILLTALGDEVDRVVGLEIGADDYITKPFSSRELVARVRALLRRATIRPETGEAREPIQGPRQFLFSGWKVDCTLRQVESPEGVRVPMTSAEFDLLVAFCRNAGTVLTRKQILDSMHIGRGGPAIRSVDVHVSRLRQKIESDVRSPALIKTVRLGGYVLTCPVEFAD